MLKRKIKFFAVFTALIMALSSISFAVKAAPASDIPADMLNNVFLDALAYTGYNVEAQKNDGTIYKQYSSAVPASVRSDISYGTGSFGDETVESAQTATGLAPNIHLFKLSGLCCASYVTYVYYNFMPNIAGIDTSDLTLPSNLRMAEAYDTAASTWVSLGKARRISFSQSGSTFSPSEAIPIGSLITFKDSSGNIKHVAIYAGTYNGKHFITHVGNERGPEFCTIEGMTKGGFPQVVAQIVTPAFVNPTGSIEVYKTDTDGNALSGAYFVATSISDPSKQYPIGPTDSNGYAKTIEKIPYGTYTVKETVFPENFREYGQTEWIVTVNETNNGSAKISVLNEIIPGNIRIEKSSEDNMVSNVVFNIVGRDVNITVETDENGVATVTDLKPGLYTVTEEKYPEYVPEEPQIISVVSGKTETVYFYNKIVRGSIEGIKTDEDNNPIENAEFGLFKYGETEFVIDNAIEVAKTNELGSFAFENIPFGKWIVKELSCPLQYVMNEQLFEFSITEDKQVLTFEVINERVLGAVQIIKLNKSNITQKLSGAEFELYFDVNANKVFEPDIDTLVGKLIEIKEGTYEYSNLKYGGYFVYETKAPEEFIRDTRYFYFEVTENGKTVVVENEKGVGFTNEQVVLEAPTSPKTGDNYNLLLSFFAIMLSGTFFTLILLKISSKNIKKVPANPLF